MNQHTAFDDPHLTPIENCGLEPLIGEYGSMRREHLLAITRLLHRLQYKFKVAAYLPNARRSGTSEPHTLKHRESACDMLVPGDARSNCWADNDVPVASVANGRPVDHSIQGSVSTCCNFTSLCREAVQIGAETELVRAQLLGARPYTVADIVAMQIK